MPFYFFRPNIAGKLDRNGMAGYQFLGDCPLENLDATGPFSGISGLSNTIVNYAEATLIKGFEFDASKSSSLYTTGSGLQVSALQVLACIKF